MSGGVYARAPLDDGISPGRYEQMWEGRGERGANFEQRVDLELARMAVYPKVEADIRQQVRWPPRGQPTPTHSIQPPHSSSLRPSGFDSVREPETKRQKMR